MCISPIRVQQPDENFIDVPCGRCPECIKRRIAQWSFRMEQEEKVSISSYFITLTYDESTVPVTSAGQRTLWKRDLQLFFKRLRRAHAGVYLKYFAVGEYGGNTGRPHYHILLFNADRGKIEFCWRKWYKVPVFRAFKRKYKGQLGRYVFEKRSCSLGFVHFGDFRGVSGSSIGYALKYMEKPESLRYPKGVEPEFVLMSKGLGANYLTEEMADWHNASYDRMYCTFVGGRRVSMPEYYKKAVYTDDFLSVAVAQASKGAKQRLFDRQLQFIRKYGDNWEEKIREFDIVSFKRMYKNSVKDRLKF